MVRDLPRFKILGACMGLVCGAGWMLRVDRTWIIGCALLVLIVPWLIGALVRTYRSRRALATDPSQAARLASLSAMRASFVAAMRAIDASPVTRQAFASAPCYLVIGAAGSGKSTALRESGAGLGAVGAEINDGATANCQWWRGASASFLDTAGRYVSDPSSRGEWLELLSLVRRRRGAGRVNGVIVVFSIAELITMDPGALRRETAAMRERIADAAERLGVSAPVYVLFTKCDQLGGFKDFFAGVTAGERDEPWGGELPWALESTHASDAAISIEFDRLASGAQARRLAMLPTAACGDQARKIFQFPGQFAAMRTWVADVLSELCREHGGMVVRGFYFSSAHAVSRVPGLMPYQGGPVAKAGPAVPAPAASIFLKVSQYGIGSPSAASGHHAGMFLRETLSRCIVGDRHLAGPSRGIQRRRGLVIGTARFGAPIGCAVVAAWILWSGTAVVGLAHMSRYPLAKARESASSGDPASILASLDELAISAVRASRPFAGELSSLLCHAYRTHLSPLLLSPCLERLHADLERMRLDGAHRRASELHELLRAYRMLTGSLNADAPTILHALSGERRWLTGLDRAGAVVPADLESAAQRQLAFVSSKLTDILGGSIEGDRHLIEQVEFELADSLWIREAYDETINALQGSFPAVRRDSLIFGPFRDVIDVGVEFPEIYTQKAFDQAVRPALRARAAIVAERLGSLDLKKPIRELEKRLEQRYREDFEQHWMELLSSTRFHGSLDVRDLSARIAVLVGAQSPYRELVTSVWKADHLQLGAIDLRTFTGDGDLSWLEPALEAMCELAKELDRFVSSTEAGKRSADPKRVHELAESFDAAWVKASVCAKSIDRPMRQAAVLKGLQGILQSILAGVTRDLTAEVNQSWLEKVRQPYLERCAKLFPFDPSATDDVPVIAFTRMFNPVSGTYWTTTNAIEELRRIRAVGVDVLPVSSGYERLRSKAQVLASGCFMGGEKLGAPFTLALRSREGVKDIHVALCDQVFGLYDRPDAKGDFIWRDGVAANAKLSISVVTGQALSLDFSGRPWGLLRLIRAGNPQSRPDGTYICTWTFENQAVGREALFRADGVLSGAGFEKALVGDVFADFTCPETIGPP